MLTLLAEQPECLWDDALPVDVRGRPTDSALPLRHDRRMAMSGSS
jgi:hypothetical protein